MFVSLLRCSVIFLRGRKTPPAIFGLILSHSPTSAKKITDDSSERANAFSRFFFTLDTELGDKIENRY